MSQPKPWETSQKPTQASQWPTEDQVKAATQPTSKSTPVPATEIPQSSGGNLEADIQQLMGALIANKCENIVVIGMSDAGQIVSMRRMGPNGSNPYPLLGALEAFKHMIISTELNQQPGQVEGQNGKPT